MHLCELSFHYHYCEHLIYINDRGNYHCVAECADYDELKLLCTRLRNETDTAAERERTLREHTNALNLQLTRERSQQEEALAQNEGELKRLRAQTQQLEEAERRVHTYEERIEMLVKELGAVRDRCRLLERNAGENETTLQLLREYLRIFIVNSSESSELI